MPTDTFFLKSDILELNNILKSQKTGVSGIKKAGVEKTYTQQNTTDHPHITDDEIPQILKNEQGQSSWRKMEKKYDIKWIDLSDYAKGRRVVNKEHRHKLGLMEYAPAPVCPKCGIVHVSKRCTKHDDRPEPTLSQLQQKALSSIQNAVKRAVRLGLNVGIEVGE